MCLWRAVDDEGEILEMIVQPYRDALTAIRLLTRLLVNTKQVPERIVTDGLGSYTSAA